MPRISTCLWFDSQAEEAAKFYCSLFNDSKIGRTSRYGKAAASATGQKVGSVMTVEFDLLGRKFIGLNGGPVFKFTPAASIFVWCRTEKELDSLWARLSEGGKARMELAKYPWSEKYGWVTDRNGLDWQLMISPEGTKLAPALLFVRDLVGKGDEAVKLYTSLFKNSKVTFMSRDEEKKIINHCVFTLDGQEVVLMEGMGDHDFQFNEAFSLFVNCRTQKEIDRYWSKLSAGGAEGPCGWLRDKFGVAWQIVPEDVGKFHADPAKSDKVMKVVLTMKKLDAAKIRKAAGVKTRRSTPLLSPKKKPSARATKKKRVSAKLTGRKK